MLSMSHSPDSFSLKVGADSELDRLSDKRDEFCIFFMTDTWYKGPRPSISTSGQHDIERVTRRVRGRCSRHKMWSIQVRLQYIWVLA
jgi:hypothetical protein